MERSGNADVSGCWVPQLEAEDEAEKEEFFERHPRKHMKDRPFTELVMYRKLLIDLVRPLAEFREKALRGENSLGDIFTRFEKREIDLEGYKKAIGEEVEACKEKGLTFGEYPPLDLFHTHTANLTFEFVPNPLYVLLPFQSCRGHGKFLDTRLWPQHQNDGRRKRQQRAKILESLPWDEAFTAKRYDGLLPHRP